jgi:hypothetical protein
MMAAMPAIESTRSSFERASLAAVSARSAADFDLQAVMMVAMKPMTVMARPISVATSAVVPSVHVETVGCCGGYIGSRHCPRIPPRLSIQPILTEAASMSAAAARRSSSLMMS